MGTTDKPDFSNCILKGENLIQNYPKIAGYIQITPHFGIALPEKPDDKHMKNMNKYFGWTWRDKIS